MNLGEYGNKAVDLSKNAYGSVSEAVDRVLHSDSTTLKPLASDERDARDQLADARKRAQKRFDELANKGEETKEDLKEKTSNLIEKAKNLASKAEKDVLKKGEEMKDAAVQKKEEAKRSLRLKNNNEAGKNKAWNEALPVDHSAPTGYVAPRSDRPLKANDPEATLRNDPGLKRLPRLSPSISALSASEPMVAQLASTIDELSAFLKDEPGKGSAAKSVIHSAQKDLEGLNKRLEFIKKSESERVDRELEKVKSKFDAQLEKTEKESLKALNSNDKKWEEEMKSNREKQIKEYEEKLKLELTTQSEIINERLREEVISQGIELQRRWMRDLKSRVEEERGGRLARLEELATELKQLERIQSENSTILDSTTNAHTLWAAARAVSSKLNATDSADEEASFAGSELKKPFREELRVLRSKSASQNSKTLEAALETLENSECADVGVESLTTLSTWFNTRVAPRIQKASLVPTDGTAGFLSHLTSSILSPIMFKKTGFPEGTDTPAVLARARYYLDRKDLDGAAREINSLEGWPKALAKDWLEASRARLEVQQAVEVS